MYTLAIESSCDDTSIAVFKDNNLITMKTASQNEIHSLYGGVVPELAARAHTQNILPLYYETLKESNIELSDISLITATYSPGLIGSLLVGLEFAKSLAIINNIEFKKVHHIAGHLHAGHITQEIEYPFLGVTVSGGHSTIYIVNDIDQYELIGWSLDDAVGEAYDKVAKMCNLGYPGGPIIDKIAKTYTGEFIDFPRPMKYSKNFNLSYSGLKTAVSLYIKNNPDYNLEQLVSSFQVAAIDVLTHKIKLASKHYNLKRIVISGGVAANSHLRALLPTLFNEETVYFPEMKYCMDNAGMIGYLGIKLHEKYGPDNPKEVNPKATNPLGRN
jgi:N6-L-threonylcarbamoyladenine synthase